MAAVSLWLSLATGFCLPSSSGCIRIAAVSYSEPLVTQHRRRSRSPATQASYHALTLALSAVLLRTPDRANRAVGRLAALRDKWRAGSGRSAALHEPNTKRQRTNRG